MASGKFTLSVILGCFVILFLCGFAGKPTVRFSHQQHIQAFGLECDRCHATAANGKPSMPAMEACAPCHEGVLAPHGSPICYQCHTSKKFKIVRTRDSRVHPYYWRTVSRNFHHGKHVADGTACSVCHPQIHKSADSLDNNYPTRADCGKCHEVYRGGPRSCEKCHRPYPEQE